MIKYEWDESNGVSVPTNKLMVIDADEYYVGMPLKKVDAETVAPTDGTPEYICLAQRNAGDEIRPLQIPVQEVFPDAVYTKIMEDGSEEKVKFGGGGGGAILDSNGKLKSEVLPDGYPHKEITVNSRLDFEASILTSKYEHYNGPVFYGDDVVISAYAGKGVAYSRGRWTLPDGYNWYCTIDGEEIKIPQLDELEYAKQNVLGDTFDGYEIKVKPNSATIFVDGVQKNNSVLLMVTIVGYGADNPLPDIQLEYRKVEIEPLDPEFLSEGIGGGDMLSVALVYDGSSYTCNKTYDEVNNALNNNIPIYAIYTEYNDNGRKLQCLFEEVRQGYDEFILFIGNAYSRDLNLYSNNEVRPEELES